ncbi:MAG: hypothetical protein GF418_00390 [Chitinivibrionales bacterium]|nr:hypothetical protein [Chitinivibrionales bacterium]MBD3394058.1 hypothetical protein [Chitinivibrionales bacterium]
MFYRLPLLMLFLAVPAVSGDADTASWLPEPDGPYALGTETLYLTDSSRHEVATRDANDCRRLIVHIYYPAELSDYAGEYRRYLDGYPEKTRKLARRFLDLPRDYFTESPVNVTVHARYRVQALDSAAPFPLVTVSHGYLSTPVVHTHLCEHLASHGYVVAAINHPYESSGAVFSDSSFVKPTMRYLRRAVFQAPQMPFLLCTKPGKRKARLTRRVLKRSRAMNSRAQVWVRDIGYIIDIMDSLNTVPKGASPLSHIIDIDRIAAIGHSFGGAAAGFACSVDLRVRCAVNMDGFQYGAEPNALYSGPVLLVETDQFAGINDMVYRHADPFYRLHIEGARHTGLTDVSLWPDLPERQHRKRIGVTGIPGKVNGAVLAFIDHCLKEQPANAIESLRENRTQHP